MSYSKIQLKIVIYSFFFATIGLFAVGEGAYADGGNRWYDRDDDYDRRNNRCRIADVTVDGTFITINGHHLIKRRHFPTVTVGGQVAQVDEINSTTNHIEATLEEELEGGSHRVEIHFGPRENKGSCDPFEVAVGGGQTASFPLTMATDQAILSGAMAYRIFINNSKISGDVAPGSLVTIKFNFSMNRLGVIYVGFDGHPCICIAPDKLSGFLQRTGTAPTAPGAHRLSILWEDASGCPVTVGNMPVDPAHGSTLGVVSVR